jgi:hypothetical protein
MRARDARWVVENARVAITGIHCAWRRSEEESIVLEETVLRSKTQRLRVAVGDVEVPREKKSRWFECGETEQMFEMMSDEVAPEPREKEALGPIHA